MKNIVIKLLVVILASFASIAAFAQELDVGSRPDNTKLKPIKGTDAILTAWGIVPGKIRLSRDVGVKEIVSFSSNPKALKILVDEAREYNIPIYGTVVPLVGKPEQEMNDEENAFRDSILADKTKEKNKYQFGGEPYHDLEVQDLSISCFHHKKVREKVMEKIRGVIMVDGIAGVAFDFFGYSNYRCCQCPLSMELAKRYHKKHPKMTETEALEAFSLESLVDFNNEMADYARSLKPGIKVRNHVHPVFLPDLYYGNRLKLDICCQTAAWFMEPYWSRERIEEHVRIIFGKEKQYYAFAEGAALLGTTATEKSSHPPKSPERVEFELRTMLNAGADRIEVCSWGDVLRSPKHLNIFKRVFNHGKGRR